MKRPGLVMRPWMAAARAALLMSLCVAGFGHAVASVLPQGFQETQVISGRTQPTAIRFAPNGHVFVAEKSGMLWLYDGIADPSPKLVIDLRTQTHNFWDRGMAGVAVAPNYPTDPSVYVTYTFDAYADGTYPRWGSPGQTADNCPTPPGATASGCVVYGRFSRITVDQSTLQGTEAVLLTGNWCQQFPSHSVDDLMFGADGYLYLSAGDGANFSGGIADYGQIGGNPCGDPPNQGGALRVQDILTQGDATSYDGSVLRLDVSGGGVAAAPGNPLIGNGVADDDYIIAVGMRNPFRMTQRPNTSEIWLGDVGWGTWEEINVISSPAAPVEDFGWPCYEGGNASSVQQGSYSSLALCQNLYSGNIPAGISLRASHYGYLHSAAVAPGDGCPSGGSSVTGIAFNTGNRYPVAYGNALFFADSTRRCAWTMFAGGNGVPDRNNIQVLVSAASGRIVDLQMGRDGYLYYVDFDGGRVFRIDYFAQNAPPSAELTGIPAYGTAPLFVQFDGSSSHDPEDGANLLYAWDLDGDGQFDDSTDIAPSKTYTAGTYTVTLRVTDSGDLSDTESVMITSGAEPPTVTITSPPPGTTWAVGDLISFTGEARDSEGELLPAASLLWDIILHHCYTVDNCHTHSVTSFPGVSSGSVDAPDHEYPSFLDLTLTANPLPVDWYDPAWTRRLKLTFNNSGQAESLPNFQALVTLNGARVSYADTLPNGADLRFTDASGSLLSHEVETWDPSGTSYVWVRVPQIAASSTSSFVYMYYGNPAASATQSPAAVWSGYGAVWHLNGNAADSTANANTGSSVNTTTVAGRMGNALNFNGSSSYVDVLNPVGLAITGTMTGEAWVKIADPNQSGNPRIFDKKSSPWTSTTGGYTLQYKPGQNNITALGNGDDFLRANSIDLDTQWHYLAAVYNGNGTGQIYLDGIGVADDTTVGALVANSVRFRMGQQTWGGEPWSGAIDEIRVNPVARSAAWIRAQNLSMRDAFITYSAPQGEGLGGSIPASVALFLAPRTADITMASAPPGIILSLGNRTEPAPFTQTVIHNASEVVTAPASQTIGGVTYNFTGWSDGGTLSHLFEAPTSNLMLTASYSAGAPNTPPAVSITSPVEGAVIAAPGAVTISADASDAEGPVAQVEFYVDGAIIDTDTSAPWSTSWNATAGDHNLAAIAFDATGLSGTSPAVPVTVLPPPDQDGDGVPNSTDNCTLVSNPSQLDANGDGYGNICDGDLNDSGLTTTVDFNLLRSVFNASSQSSPLAAAADMNGSGLVTAADFILLRARINTAPGPSGLHP